MIFVARPTRLTFLAVGLGFLTGSAAQAQLRVMTWNVSNYTGGRTVDIQAAVYGVFEGRSASPDIVIAQEFMSTSAMTAFKNALNGAAGSPGDWEGVYVPGPGGSEGNAFFYRTGKVSYLGYLVISQGGSYPNPPRNTVRFSVKLQGYASNKAVLCCFHSHMKAGNEPNDVARRLTEAQRIRDNAETLNPDFHFLLGADLNMQTSSEGAYVELVGSQPNNTGRFFDPIASPGTWRDNSLYRFIHTQDPIASNGGMDDRFDQILVSADLIDGDGFDYLGNATIPYSMTTWNDPNHSYRSWGNDGTSLNQGLTVTGNTMVGAAIAQALINVATTSGGHLPVFADFRVPPEIDSDTALDFGQVEQGATAEQLLAVWNAGNVTRWNAAGIADLSYSLTASAGFSAPGGTFVDAGGGGQNQHVVAMDTSTVGQKNGTVTITSNAPDQPSRVVTVAGEVIPATWAKGDMNCDGFVNFADINPFVLALGGQTGYESAYPDCNWFNGDCNNDGLVNFADINAFVALLGG